MVKPAEENIVSLEDYGHSYRKTPGGRSEQALNAVYKIASDTLRKHLEQMMDKVDDTLFCRAEISENNSVQTRYFDAMREMRIIRKDIENSFVKSLHGKFSRGIPRDDGSIEYISLSWESDDIGMGLLDKGELEEQLAIANLVNKIRGNCAHLLFSLDKRIGFLINDLDLEHWHNPLGPAAICAAFREAAQHIETGIEIRLITFKLFDQYVTSNLEELYKELNQHLAKLGVLPQIKVTVRKPGGSATTSSEQAVGTGTSAASNVSPGYSSQGHSNPAMNVLTLLQHGEQESQAGALAGLNNTDLVSGQINILHHLQRSELIDDMGKTGNMTINVVAMIFDYILDDGNIPDAMRALIGRLQIPVLKVALLDRHFLSRKSHPARQLLNRLAATAVGWDEEHGEQDPVYKKIHSIVQTILDTFDENIELFEILLRDFEQFLEKEESEAKLRAERSAKVMEGQERLEVAKTTTMNEIESRVSDQENLDFVREFVATHWKNLLFVCCARHGKDSDAWKQAVGTMDDLIWSIKPKRTPEDRQRLVALQPQLLKNLRGGMERLSIPPTERDKFLTQLVRTHGRTAAPAISDAPQCDSRSDKVTQLEQVHMEPARPDPAVTTSARTGEHHNLAQVQALKPGTWIEFISIDGKATRAKLSWISPITGTYLFTNRQGLKAGNYDPAELVRMLDNKLVRVLNSTPLMDRAVSNALKEGSDR